MKLPKIYVYINKIFNIQSSYFNYILKNLQLLHWTFILFYFIMLSLLYLYICNLSLYYITYIYYIYNNFSFFKMFELFFILGKK